MIHRHPPPSPHPRVYMCAVLGMFMRVNSRDKSRGGGGFRGTTVVSLCNTTLRCCVVAMLWGRNSEGEAQRAKLKGDCPLDHPTQI